MSASNRVCQNCPRRAGNAADLDGENFNALLQRHGIGLPKQAMAGTAADAAVKAKEIGFPVAVKLIAAEVVHKTESGAVVLGLKSAEEVQAEGQKLLTKTLGRGHLLDSRNGAGDRSAHRRAHRSAVRAVS